MRIVTVRRISQVFFVGLFLWLCIVSSVGTSWWQLRGWPINLFIHLDPLAALALFLTTGTVYGALLLSLLTLVLTVVFGRFFCSWVCPFGTLHHATGFLARRQKPLIEKVKLNQYRRAQRIKYYILFFVLGAAALSGIGLLLEAAGVGNSLHRFFAGSIQSGLLDPISLMYRSVNLVVLPLAERLSGQLSATPHFYEGAWLIGVVFGGAILLNLVIPRFYCRFICPLGALLGIFSRFALWRVGKTEPECSMCMRCETDCEGACEPATRIRVSECVLCMNCLRTCQDDVITYNTGRSAAGDVSAPDVTRRGFLVSTFSGALLIPAVRLSNRLGFNWNPRLIRPPGSLAEADFLERCIKCGQCMRVCPTNIIQPAGADAGLEAVWTPTLNFRIGDSGCQLNCVACGNVCPTAAIRPITLDEKLGRGPFKDQGPTRLGLAAVDRGRCLPWAMDRPCLVCQENCPVSPKAIYVEEHFNTVRDGIHKLVSGDELTVDFGKPVLPAGAYGSGDYYCRIMNDPEARAHRVISNSENILVLDSNDPFPAPPKPGTQIAIQVRLRRPVVDPEKCIGCGICEHECPIMGMKAIRVTSDNESRDRTRAILPGNA